jgi:hypothetical protein
MSLRVLRAGLDTVEVSLSGAFSEESIVMLDQAKEQAVVMDRPIPVRVNVLELQVQPKAFGYWRWRLVDPRFSIVGKRKAAAGAATVQVRFSAFGLANEHPDMLWMLIRAVLADLGSFERLSVSRADVCVDTQGWVPSPAEMANMVVPVSYRATHGTSAEVQTYQWGKRTLLRAYNKTAELESSKKSWLYDVWGQCDNYRYGEPVWRFEFQAASDVLRQLGITCAETLFERQAALLDYGLTWCQLRVPSDDRTKTRWPEDPRWSELRKAVFCGLPLQRSVKASELMSLDAAKRRLIGLAALAGAYFDTDDYLSALQRLSFAAEVFMMSEGMDFAALVEEKRQRVLSSNP